MTKPSDLVTPKPLVVVDYYCVGIVQLAIKLSLLLGVLSDDIRMAVQHVAFALPRFGDQTVTTTVGSLLTYGHSYLDVETGRIIRDNAAGR